MLPSWERAIPGGSAIRGSALAVWEVALSQGRLVPTCLPACEEIAITLVDCEVSQVIFPSFLHTKLLNLFTCLFLTLLNLNSSTFSTKIWQFLKLVVGKIETNFDLHSSFVWCCLGCC